MKLYYKLKKQQPFEKKRVSIVRIVNDKGENN